MLTFDHCSQPRPPGLRKFALNSDIQCDHAFPRDTTEYFQDPILLYDCSRKHPIYFPRSCDIISFGRVEWEKSNDMNDMLPYDDESNPGFRYRGQFYNIFTSTFGKNLHIDVHILSSRVILNLFFLKPANHSVKLSQESRYAAIFPKEPLNPPLSLVVISSIEEAFRTSPSSAILIEKRVSPAMLDRLPFLIGKIFTIFSIDHSQATSLYWRVSDTNLFLLLVVTPSVSSCDTLFASISGTFRTNWNMDGCAKRLSLFELTHTLRLDDYELFYSQPDSCSPFLPPFIGIQVDVLARHNPNVHEFLPWFSDAITGAGGRLVNAYLMNTSLPTSIRFLLQLDSLSVMEGCQKALIRLSDSSMNIKIFASALPNLETQSRTISPRNHQNLPHCQTPSPQSAYPRPLFNYRSAPSSPPSRQGPFLSPDSRTISHQMELLEMRDSGASSVPTTPTAVHRPPTTSLMNEITPWRIENGLDSRTTCMLRNIPNKYTQRMLIDFIDETHRGTYDFVYLRMDFKNKCNVGYAFINFIDPKHVVTFAKITKGMRWAHFNTTKICDLTYANIQGRDALIRKFRNSSVMEADPDYRPKLFFSSGPLRGLEEKFPLAERPFM